MIVRAANVVTRPRGLSTRGGVVKAQPGWRNWQTQRTQNPPRATSWGFDPPSRHHTTHLFSGKYVFISPVVNSPRRATQPMWTPRFIRSATSFLCGLPVATFRSVLYYLSFNVIWGDSCERLQPLSICIPVRRCHFQVFCAEIGVESKLFSCDCNISLQHEFYGAIDNLIEWDFGQGKWHQGCQE